MIWIFPDAAVKICFFFEARDEVPSKILSMVIKVCYFFNLRRVWVVLCGHNHLNSEVKVTKITSQENPVELGHSLPKGATMIFDFPALHLKHELS